MIKKTHKNKFNDDGYSFYKALIPKKKISTFFKIFKLLLNANYNYKNFDCKYLSEKIVKIKKKNPDKINYLYKNIVHVSAFINLFENYALRKIAAKLINANPDSLIISEHQFRIDYPSDKKHILNWHQDAVFYPQDPKGKNSLVCNISLHNINESMGSTILLKGSHKNGILKYQKIKGNSNRSGQRQISLKKKYEYKTFETNIGDVSFYDARLIHKSGYNISNNVRFSCIARIFNPRDKDYNSFEKISQKLK